MDAISFVLGVKSSKLRSAHLKELLYRSTAVLGQDSSTTTTTTATAAATTTELEDNIQRANSAYVMALYEKSDGTRIQFKRRSALRLASFS